MKITESLRNRAALFIPLVSLGLFVIFTFLSISSLYSALVLNFQESGKRAVETVASVIDEDSFKKTAEKNDSEDEYYKKMQETMYSYKSLVQMEYIYTMVPFEGSEYRYIIDGSSLDEEAEGFSPIGTIEDLSEWDDYELINRAIETKRTVVTDIVQDSWGSLISAYTPLLDNAGNVYGFVGADFDATDLVSLYDTKKKQLLTISIISISFIFISIAITLLNMNSMGKMHRMQKTLGMSLLAEADGLVKTTKETSETATNQSAAVKEIVSTMEENSSLSSTIAQKINGVEEEARNNFSHVNEGIKSLEEASVQMKEITDANKETISGIDVLKDRIEGIFETTSSISSLADSAKIIAFNAELEACNADNKDVGGATKKHNFSIIATEIRRLADDIIDGTKEINASINDVRESSNNLVKLADGSTKKIAEENESFRKLESNFNDIKESSQSTTQSTARIASIMKQQSESSSQILITLKSMAGGIENLTSSTESIFSSTEKLREIATELHEEKKGRKPEAK